MIYPAITSHPGFVCTIDTGKLIPELRIYNGSVCQHGKQLLFAYGGRTLTSRMLEGKFPAYERIIPYDNDKHVVVGDGGAFGPAPRRRYAVEVTRCERVPPNKLGRDGVQALLLIEAEQRLHADVPALGE